MRMIVKLRAVTARVEPGIGPGSGLMSGVDRRRLYMVTVRPFLRVEGIAVVGLGT
jgi:hypothetical protein